jgi:hypothetical protein
MLNACLPAPLYFSECIPYDSKVLERLAGHIGRDGEVLLEDYISRWGYPALLKWELEEDCASRWAADNTHRNFSAANSALENPVQRHAQIPTVSGPALFGANMTPIAILPPANDITIVRNAFRERILGLKGWEGVGPAGPITNTFASAMPLSQVRYYGAISRIPSNPVWLKTYIAAQAVVGASAQQVAMDIEETALNRGVSALYAAAVHLSGVPASCRQGKIKAREQPCSTHWNQENWESLRMHQYLPPKFRRLEDIHCSVVQASLPSQALGVATFSIFGNNAGRSAAYAQGVCYHF